MRHLERQIQVLEGASRCLQKKGDMAGPADMMTMASLRLSLESVTLDELDPDRQVDLLREQMQAKSGSKGLLHGSKAEAMLKEEKARQLEKKAQSRTSSAATGAQAMTMEDYKNLPGL